MLWRKEWNTNYFKVKLIGKTMMQVLVGTMYYTYQKCMKQD